MQAKILTAVIAGVITVAIVELFLRPNFPNIRQTLDNLSGVEAALIVG